MDATGHVYLAPLDQIPPEDLARYDGYQRGKSYCSVEVEWHDGKRTNHPWEGEMIAVRSKPGEISLTKPLVRAGGPTSTQARYETSPSA